MVRWSWVLGVALYAAVVQGNENLVQNPHFDDAGAHWELGHYGPGSDVAAVDEATGRQGGSLRCDVTAAEQFAHWSQGGISVPEGAQVLKLSVWCRAEAVDNTFATIGVAFEDDAGYWVADRLWMIVVANDTDWRRFEGYARVPRGVETIRVHGWVNYQFRGAGRFWFDDVTLTVAEPDDYHEPETHYRDLGPRPEATAEETARGYMLYSRTPNRVLFSQSVPRAGERVSELAADAAPGEYVPVVLALHALRDLEGVRVSVSSLAQDNHVIPSGQVDVRNIRFHPRVGDPRWGPFNETVIPDVPLFLERRHAVDVPQERTQPFWLTVHVPEDAAPGAYAGTVTVRAAGDDHSAEIPLRLRVHPFKLDEAHGIKFAMYTRLRDDRDWVRESFEDMRRHGMSSVAIMGGSGLELRMENGAPAVEWTGNSVLEMNLDEYVRAGFTEPVLWLMGGGIERFCREQGEFASEAFDACYRSIIEQLTARGVERGWPEIIFQPLDEPFEHPARLDDFIHLLRLLRSVPGVRTEGNGMNGAWHRFDDRAYELLDVLTFHDGPLLERGQLDMDRWWAFHARAMADNKEIWYYNIDLSAWRPEPLQFMTGFGLWKAKSQGIVQWSYMTPVNPADPGAVYGRPDNYAYRYPAAPGESGGPTVGYMAVREGVYDYRYLLTLHNRVERARASADAYLARLADAVWEPVQAKLDAASFGGSRGKAGQGEWTGPLEVLPDGTRVVSGDHKIDNNWEFDDYYSLRVRLAEGIAALDAVLGATK